MDSCRYHPHGPSVVIRARNYIQKWIVYHEVHDLTDFWLTWDPTDPDDIILSNTFALPQFMAQHNCEDLNPTDTPSTVPTAFKLQVITPSILSVLITHWQPSAINLSTLP